MGCAVLRELPYHPELELCCVLEEPSSPHIGKDAGSLTQQEPLGVPIQAATTEALPAVFGSVDALVDFSTPQACVALSAYTPGKIHIIGVTGFSPAQEQTIHQAAQHCVIVKSANFSQGVHVLAALVKNRRGSPRHLGCGGGGSPPQPETRCPLRHRSSVGGRASGAMSPFRPCA